MPEKRGQCVKFLFEPQPFHANENTVPQSPNNESRIRSVPNSAKEKNEEKIAIGDIGMCGFASAKRNVEVISQPRGKGNMPAPPKFPNGRTDVGTVEVFFKTETRHSGKSDSHIGIG